MKSITDISNILSRKKDLLFKHYGIKNMAIFGSYSRNEQLRDSDIDILVEFNKPIGIEFIDLAEELETMLGSKVDLVSKNGIKPKYFKVIERELIYV